MGLKQGTKKFYEKKEQINMNVCMTLVSKTSVRHKRNVLSYALHLVFNYTTCRSTGLNRRAGTKGPLKLTLRGNKQCDE